MKIEITVTSTGQTKVQTQGFTGSSCREASQFMEQALGSRIGETLTSEFHQGTIRAEAHTLTTR